MSASLYRRHRPRTFDEVVGQEHIVRTLKNAVELGRVHHAYLFVGSRGTGKTSMAKLLACALNAEGGPRTDFSLEDPACKAIADGTSLDVVEMDAASNNSVDDIRELRENVVLAPMGGARRVYILDEAHMLSAAAWNAFLKTLEEPPPHVVFVLATTEAHKVPATIVDRCHRFDFHRPSLAQVADVLRRVAADEGIEVPDAAVGMIARAANGSFRDALGTLEQLVTYGGKHVDVGVVLELLGVADAELVLETTEALIEHDPKAALLAVERLASAGTDFTQFMRDLAAHLRHLFVAQTMGEVPESFAVTAEHTDRLSSQIERLPQPEILRAIDLFAAAIAQVKEGSEPRIQLELALMKATQPQSDASLPALMFRIEQLERRIASVAGGKQAPEEAPRDSGPSAAAPASPAAVSRGGPTAASSAGPAAPTAAAAGGPAAPAARPVAAAAAASEPEPEPESEPEPEPLPDLDLERLRAVWPAAVDAVAEENAMVGALLREARPSELAGDKLVVAFSEDAAFSKKKAEANRELLHGALRSLTGCSLAIAYELSGEVASERRTLTEDELLERLKAEFGAEEVFEDSGGGS